MGYYNELLRASPLTKRQADIVRFVVAYTSEHGVPPSLRCMALACGAGARTKGPSDIRRIAARGFLRRAHGKWWPTEEAVRFADMGDGSRGASHGGSVEVRVALPGDHGGALHVQRRLLGVDDGADVFGLVVPPEASVLAVGEARVGDVLFVQRGVPPANDDLVLCHVEGDPVIRRHREKVRSRFAFIGRVVGIFRRP